MTSVPAQDGERAKEAAEIDGCPNGPDEYGNWPCDPKGYFGVAECQVCGRIARWPALASSGAAALASARGETRRP